MIALLWTVVLLACEPCDECGQPLQYDPNVRFKFINFDSLVALDTSISRTTDSLSILDSSKDSVQGKVNEWTGLMIAFRDSIAQGRNEYVDDTVRITDSLNTASSALMDLDTALLYTNQFSKFLTEARDLVLSGRVLVDTIEIIELSKIVTYFDSAETYSIPLILQDANQTTYKIHISGQIDTIGFTYNPNLSVDVERKVKLRAEDIDTVMCSYDSLYFENCQPPDCMDNEILVVIYF